MSELLTIADVARMWGVHAVTVRRRIAAGRLPAERVGRTLRVRREDLESAAPADGDGDHLPPPGPPFTEDDPLWDLVGKFDDPEGAWVSSDKHRALAEAYRTKP